MNRKERKARAKKKVLMYAKEFNKASKAYIDRVEDPIKLIELIRSKEIRVAWTALVKLKPSEKDLINQGLELLATSLSSFAGKAE